MSEDPPVEIDCIGLESLRTFKAVTVPGSGSKLRSQEQKAGGVNVRAVQCNPGGETISNPDPYLHLTHAELIL